MSKIHQLVFFILIGVLLVSSCNAQTPTATAEKAAIPSSTASFEKSATPEPVPEVDPALLAAIKKCVNIVPGQACLVEGPVIVTAQPGRTLRPFQKPGQVINLADLQTLKLGEAGSTRGLVVMRIQSEWSESVFTAVAFGYVELVNEVPYGTREFNPMQSLKLTTAENEEGSIIGFFVASPEDGNLSTLVVNGLELSFGSGGWLTSREGGLTIQTMWGSIGAWFQDRIVQIKRGFGIKLTHEEIEREIAKMPSRGDYKAVMIERAMAIYFGCADWKTNPGCGSREDPATDNKSPTNPATDKKYQALEEQRKKQKQWKGGWWKMTYGPTTTNGQCKGAAVGDGYDGGDSQPYTTELPICRGNNGRTILMYDSGTSYNLVAPNLYAKSSVTEFDMLGNGNLTTEGRFTTLQIVSPTRMILGNAGAEVGSCTTASVAWLEYLRDDPNVRCGRIIEISYFATPKPPTPTPEPQDVEPPIEDPYQVRFGKLAKACDPAAQPYAPSFTSAGLSLSPENKLVIHAPAIQYELELSNLTTSYSSQKIEGEKDRLGVFTLQQPLDSSFNLTMSLVQMPNQLYTGNWLVANRDGSQLCVGPVDMFPPD